MLFSTACVASTVKLSVSHQGGESVALKRLEEHLADKAWVLQFEKPKGNPAALEPATTVLSPYLKFGCLSVRVFYKRLQEVCQYATQLWLSCIYACSKVHKDAWGRQLPSVSHSENPVAHSNPAHLQLLRQHLCNCYN